MWRKPIYATVLATGLAFGGGVASGYTFDDETADDAYGSVGSYPEWHLFERDPNEIGQWQQGFLQNDVIVYFHEDFSVSNALYSYTSGAAEMVGGQIRNIVVNFNGVVNVDSASYAPPNSHDVTSSHILMTNGTLNIFGQDLHITDDTENWGGGIEREVWEGEPYESGSYFLTNVRYTTSWQGSVIDGDGGPGNVNLISSGVGLTADGVTGTIAADETVVITALSGESFGNTGPKVRIFDDYRSGVVDETHEATPTYSATSQEWSRTRGQIYEHPDLSHGKGVQKVNSSGGGQIAHFIWKEYPEYDVEIFVFSTVFSPPGTNQPDGNSKNFWVGGENPNSQGHWYQNNNQPDLVLFGMTNGGISGTRRIQSNDTAASRSTWDTSDWTPATDEPYTLSMHLKGDTTVAGTTGRAIGIYPSLSAEVKSYANYKNLFVQADDPIGFNRINHVGFYGHNVNPGDILVFDDFYLATGPGAPARVEITDNENYLDSNRRAISTPTAWSDTEITVILRGGTFGEDEDAFENMYLHIHDADDEHTNGGIGRLIN